MKTAVTRLKATGWRQDGDKWFPPWPSRYSYTLRAALLEQAIAVDSTPARKAKRRKAEATP